MSKISPLRLRVPRFSSAKLECDLPDAYWRIFFWVPYMTDLLVANSRTLIISNVTLQDSGYYCCAFSEVYFDLVACSVIVIISEAS